MAKNDRRIKYASDTEKPVMVSVRLPRELYDRLERYASQHQQSISELLKDGAVMRLETEVDPRYRSAESTSDDTELQIDGASILRDMQATLARHDTQMHALMQAIERQTTPAGHGLSDGASYHVIQGNTAIEPEGQERHSSSNTVIPTGKRQRTAEPATESPQVSGDGPLYDASKQHLGKLCPRRHDYNGSGHSLRNTGNQCLKCKAEEKREKRAQQRQSAV